MLLVCLPFVSPRAVGQVNGAGGAAQLPSLTLEDLYSEYNAVDTDISPSGKMLAAVVRRKDDDALVSVDLATGEKKLITRINKDSFGDQLDVRMGFVYWKTDDRLLLQLRSRPNKGLKFDHMSQGNWSKLGDRLYAVDRDGKNIKPMFGTQYDDALVGAFDTSDIASMLWNDPKHILVKVGGWDGRSLFKVDIDTGEGKIIEKQREGVIDWWLDVNGAPVVRIEYSVGTLRYYRKLPDGSWKKYHSERRHEGDELVDYEGIGPSNDPGKFYVRARPPGKDRVGLYLYDLQKEDFGAPLVENPNYDIVSAKISADGTRIDYNCYDAHVRICDFADPQTNAYMKALRKFFDEQANVYVTGASDDGKVILLSVDSPSDAPAFYYYLVEQKKIELVGVRQGALKGKSLPHAAVITYKTRDGQSQSGYLTYPPGGENAKGLPLVLMPHGGPQARDRLEFDPWVQYLAARGYAVFQPNFRGSGGFGEAFEFAGHREWGRKMQDDLDDGVKALVDQGTVDAARVCIVGASYGGYAALAGATLTPNAYKCAVSLAGVGDLEEFVRWKKKKYGADSDVFVHFVKAIGDPDKDQAAIRAVSPAYHIDAIKIPILLIHGDKDEIVPYSQSESLQKLLNKSGHKTELLKVKDGGHGGFEDDDTKVVLSTIGSFLWDNLGKGYGVSEPPVKYNFEK
jgi:dipeptidyl aminopeptidase/acylaminoacyl peptidase